MENKDIYQLLDRFEASDLSTLEIKKGDEKILMKKGSSYYAPVMEPKNLAASTGAETIADAGVGSGAGASHGNDSSEKQSHGSDSKLKEIKAPLVGLFYRTPSPDDDPYVKVGDKVSKGQVLCVIEAMKMFNELKSPVDGVIKNIIPESGAAVEFNQVLFEVEEC